MRRFKVQCRGGGADALKSVPSLADNTVMFMPGGLSTITPSQNGAPVTVTVLVDKATAEAMEAQRQAMESAGKKPYFGIGEDSHASDLAAFWPAKFFWATRRDATGQWAEGVWAEGEWTSAGREAVEGKTVRTFSPTFFVDAVRNDPENPVHVVCCEEAKANMGALLNDPAFARMSPLFAHNATTISGMDVPGRAGATGDKQRKAMNPTKAELQARNKKLELTINGLSGKDDANSRIALAEAKGELSANEARIRELDAVEGRQALENREKERIELQAEAALDRMVGGQASVVIGALDKEERAKWKGKFVADPSLIDVIAPLTAARQPQQQSLVPVNNAPAGKMSPLAAARYDGVVDPYAGIGGDGFDLKDCFTKYYAMLARNAKVPVHTSDLESKRNMYRTKGMMALDAANYYNEHLRGNEARWRNIPAVELGKLAGVYDKSMQAADYSDPNNNVGLLTGTLVLQRCLPDFAYDYPEIRSMMTDFADTPGLYQQTETTRKVLQPAVQKWNATLGSDGRPSGWSTVSPAKTTDISMTLTDYVAVPINFGNDILAATARKLFDEQGHLAVKAIADYFVQMMVKLCTAANYNAYITATTTNPSTVPVAYTTYVPPGGLSGWTLACLDDLQAAFDANKVPQEDRGILLNPTYYAKLRQDPRLTVYMQTALSAGANPDFVAKGKLMELVGFMPYKAPYIPTTITGQNNLVGFAFQKAGVVLKSRLPNDFTTQLGAPIPGSVTTVTDPDTGISLMLVQYVNLTQNYAEWRPEVMLGAAVGDNRGGLVVTSA